ncbi:MAG: hypothetical protein GY859_07950 [Desulfobacterales bacterium]|nr:hypothetical protein [Desulfobacterales bacterium]
MSDEQLAEMMLTLQARGCHNINFVTPTHATPAILAATALAAEGGLNVPLVYNCGGYERVKTLKLLEGVVDIYMPDFKFWDPVAAADACDAPDYPSAARKALKEMHRQVGDLVLDASGVAQKGVLLRHLVMPDGLAGTRDVMKFVAGEISANTYVNIMPQYRPCGRAHEVPGLSVPPSDKDFEAAYSAAREEGVTRLDERRRVFRFL